MMAKERVSLGLFLVFLLGVATVSQAAPFSFISTSASTCPEVDALNSQITSLTEEIDTLSGYNAEGDLALLRFIRDKFLTLQRMFEEDTQAEKAFQDKLAKINAQSGSPSSVSAISTSSSLRKTEAKLLQLTTASSQKTASMIKEAENFISKLSKEEYQKHISAFFSKIQSYSKLTGQERIDTSKELVSLCDDLIGECEKILSMISTLKLQVTDLRAAIVQAQAACESFVLGVVGDFRFQGNLESSVKPVNKANQELQAPVLVASTYNKYPANGGISVAALPISFATENYMQGSEYSIVSEFTPGSTAVSLLVINKCDINIEAIGASIVCNGDSVAASSTSFVAPKQYIITVVRDAADVVSVYVNGALDMTFVDSKDEMVLDGSIDFGAAITSTISPSGTFYRVVIHNEAILEETIKSYTFSKLRRPNGLVADFRFTTAKTVVSYVPPTFTGSSISREALAAATLSPSFSLSGNKLPSSGIALIPKGETLSFPSFNYLDPEQYTVALAFSTASISNPVGVLRFRADKQTTGISIRNGTLAYVVNGAVVASAATDFPPNQIDVVTITRSNTGSVKVYHNTALVLVVDDSNEGNAVLRGDDYNTLAFFAEPGTSSDANIYCFGIRAYSDVAQDQDAVDIFNAFSDIVEDVPTPGALNAKFLFTTDLTSSVVPTYSYPTLFIPAAASLSVLASDGNSSLQSSIVRSGLLYVASGDSVVLPTTHLTKADQYTLVFQFALGEVDQVFSLLSFDNSVAAAGIFFNPSTGCFEVPEFSLKSTVKVYEGVRYTLAVTRSSTGSVTVTLDGTKIFSFTDSSRTWVSSGHVSIFNAVVGSIVKAVSGHLSLVYLYSGTTSNLESNSVSSQWSADKTIDLPAETVAEFSLKENLVSSITPSYNNTTPTVPARPARLINLESTSGMSKFKVGGGITFRAGRGFTLNSHNLVSSTAYTIRFTVSFDNLPNKFVKVLQTRSTDSTNVLWLYKANTTSTLSALKVGSYAASTCTMAKNTVGVITISRAATGALKIYLNKNKCYSYMDTGSQLTLTSSNLNRPFIFFNDKNGVENSGTDSSGNSNQDSGVLYNVKLWNKALSDTEIVTDQNSVSVSLF